MEKGAIYYCKKKGIKHYVIFWEQINTNDFKGVMITHSSTEEYENNIPFEENDFEKGYKVGFDKSYFLRIGLSKQKDWFEQERQIGQLTHNGICKIEKYISENTMLWKDYFDEYIDNNNIFRK
jgi:hypothetical protein